MFAMSAPGIQVVSLWTHFVPDQQVKSVVFFDIEAVVNDCVVVWAFSSAEVVDNPVRQILFIVQRDNVIPVDFVAASNKTVFSDPTQATWMFVRQL